MIAIIDVLYNLKLECIMRLQARILAMMFIPCFAADAQAADSPSQTGFLASLTDVSTDFKSEQPQANIPVSAFVPSYFFRLDYGEVIHSNAPDSGVTPAFIAGSGYNFNKYFSFEGSASLIKTAKTPDDSYNSMGIIYTNSPSHSTSTKSYQFAAVGRLPLSNNDFLVGKIGIAYVGLNYSYYYKPCDFFTCSAPISGYGSGAKNNLLIGIAWERKLEFIDHTTGKPPPATIRLLYENYGKIALPVNYSDGTSRTYNVRIDVLSFGIIYTF